jgi:predicted histidine transporter YuiF (NhaC family)
MEKLNKVITSIVDWIGTHGKAKCILSMIVGIIVMMGGCAAIGGSFGTTLGIMTVLIGLLVILYGIWDYHNNYDLNGNKKS